MTLFANTTRALIAAAVVGCSAALVVGCGTPARKPSPPAAPPTVKPAATPTPTPPSRTSAQASPPPTTTAPSQAAALPCVTSALRVKVPASQGNAAAGSSYYPIQFENVSGASCTLFGYPGVSFVTAPGGSQIGPAATQNPAFAKKLLALSPGQTVHAELQVVNAENYPASDCGLVTAHWLKVYPPNQTAPLYAGFTASTCSQPRQVLSVQTVQAGLSGP